MISVGGRVTVASCVFPGVLPMARVGRGLPTADPLAERRASDRVADPEAD